VAAKISVVGKYYKSRMQEKGGKRKAVTERSWRGIFSRDCGTGKTWDWTRLSEASKTTCAPRAFPPVEIRSTGQPWRLTRPLSAFWSLVFRQLKVTKFHAVG